MKIKTQTRMMTLFLAKKRKSSLKQAPKKHSGAETDRKIKRKTKRMSQQRSLQRLNQKLKNKNRMRSR